MNTVHGERLCGEEEAVSTMRCRHIPLWARILLTAVIAYFSFVGLQAIAYGMDLLEVRNMGGEQTLRFFFKS